MKASLGTLSALLVLALVLAACGAAATSETPAAAVEGKQWKLVSYMTAEYETVEVLPDSEITMVVNRGQVSGSGSCNQYTGTYTISGETLTVKAMGTTQMYCAPEELMGQEKMFLTNLNKATSYKSVGNQLQLKDSDGYVLLTFTPLEPTPLVGTTWGLTSYNNGKGGMTSPVAGSEVTAVFGSDGNLTGSAGCNTYSAAYKLDGVQISIGPVTSTRMACAEPKGIMEQETAYLAALGTVIRYEIEGDELRLLTAGGVKAAVYSAKP